MTGIVRVWPGVRVTVGVSPVTVSPDESTADRFTVSDTLPTAVRVSVEITAPPGTVPNPSGDAVNTTP